MGFLQTHNIQLPTKEGAIEDLFDKTIGIFNSVLFRLTNFFKVFI